MEFSTNKDGNLVASFTSPINYDNGYTSERVADKAASTMELFLHDGATKKEGSGCIEWCVLDDVIQIGVWWEDGKLTDYDGCFDFPEEAAKLMRKYGVKVSKDFYE